MVISLPVRRDQHFACAIPTSSMHASLKAPSRTPSLVPFLRITSPRLLSAPRRRTCRSQQRPAGRPHDRAARGGDNGITSNGYHSAVLIIARAPLFKGFRRVPFKVTLRSISRFVKGSQTAQPSRMARSYGGMSDAAMMLTASVAPAPIQGDGLPIENARSRVVFALKGFEKNSDMVSSGALTVSSRGESELRQISELCI